MPHVITEACIGRKDAACAAICPCNCIHPKREEGDFEAASQLYINPGECIDCGLCIDECPVEAIYPDTDVPPQWQQYIALNAEHYGK